MFDFLFNIFSLLLVLAPLIFIHEFGHFLMAKLLGIKVEVFSLGFGPRLFWFLRGGTEYRVSLLPLGGYVRMLGENPDEDLAGSKEEFLSRPKRERFLVLVMGAAFNILLAIVLMTVTFQLGVQEPYYLDQPVVIGAIEPGSAAEKVDLFPGDRIFQIDGHEVSSWKEFQVQEVLSPHKRWNLLVDRDGKVRDVEILLTASTPYRIGHAGIVPQIRPLLAGIQPGLPGAHAGLKDGDLILTMQGNPVRSPGEFVTMVQANAGIPLTITYSREGEKGDTVLVPIEREGKGFAGVIVSYRQVTKKYGLLEGFRQSLRSNWRNAGLVFITLRKLLGRELSPYALSGPVDIARISAISFRRGLVPFLTFLAVVSLQLGIFNLLPIPVLDGGHIFILLIEGVMRRDLSMKLKERVIQFGFLFLVSFMVLVIILDFDKLDLTKKLLEFIKPD